MLMSRLADIELVEAILFGLFGLLGVLAIVASLANLDWFFNAREAKPIVKWLGRIGARIFYILLGILLLLASFAGFSGWKP